MEAANVFVVLSVLVLLIIAVLFVRNRRRFGEPLSPLTKIAFLFLIGGLFVGQNRLLGYGLFGIGVSFAVADIIVKQRQRDSGT